jgi:hypothetical protein
MGLFYIVYHHLGTNEMTLLDIKENFREAKEKKKEYLKFMDNGNKIKILKLQEQNS